ncbi:PAS domain S-box protein [Pseudomonadota bacterium]
MTQSGNNVRYKKLVEHMNEAVWMGDKEERTIYANPKFANLLGYTLDEMMGQKSYIFWDKESAKRVRNVNTTKRKKGISSSYEGNLLTKDGKLIPVLLSGTPLPDGGTIGIMTDLTELKKKEEKEKVLNNAIKYATDAIITFDSQGNIESWNKGAKIMFGYRKEEVLGDNIDRIFSVKDLKSILKQKEVLYDIELEAAQRNKRLIKVSATFTPLYAKDTKRVTHFLLIARDITEHTKFEEEMTLKYQKMRDAYNNFGIMRRQMDYIFELLEMAAEHSDQKTVSDFIVSSIIMLTRVDACVLRRFNKDDETLDLISSFGVGEHWNGKANIRFQGSLARKAFNKNAPLKIIEISKEPRYQSRFLAKKSNLSSLLLIPLIHKFEIVGTLSLYASPQRKLEIFENDFVEKYALLISMIVAQMHKEDSRK